MQGLTRVSVQWVWRMRPSHTPSCSPALPRCRLSFLAFSPKRPYTRRSLFRRVRSLYFFNRLKSWGLFCLCVEPVRTGPSFQRVC